MILLSQPIRLAVVQSFLGFKWPLKATIAWQNDYQLALNFNGQLIISYFSCKNITVCFPSFATGLPQDIFLEDLINLTKQTLRLPSWPSRNSVGLFSKFVKQLCHVMMAEFPDCLQADYNWLKQIMTNSSHLSKEQPQKLINSPASFPLPPQEIGGPNGPEPTRYGDWEKQGRCYDF